MCVLYLPPLLTPSIIFPVDLLKFKLTLLNFLMLNLYRRKKGKPTTYCFASVTEVLSVVM